MSAGLASIRFHDLRHFFASMLIAEGQNAKYIGDQMGHSTIRLTCYTYGHLFPQAKQEASSWHEEVMFANRKEPLVENPPKKPSTTRDGKRPN